MKTNLIRLVFAMSALSLGLIMMGCGNDDGQGGLVSDLPMSTMSYGLDAVDADNCSNWPDANEDGRFVCFESDSEYLIPDDPNSFSNKNVFVKDRATGEIIRASLTWDGKVPNDCAVHSAISGNGRYVAFMTEATNMLPTDEAPIVADDRMVGTAAEISTVKRIFVRDVLTGELFCPTMAWDGSLPDNCSNWPRFSKTGRWLVFQSDASNLLPPGEDTNSEVDVFCYDMQTRSIRRVNLSADGIESDDESSHPAISGNGEYIVFASEVCSWESGLTSNRNRIYAVSNPLR